MIYSLTDQHAITNMLMERYEKSGFSSMQKFGNTVGLLPADMTNLSKRKWADNPQLIGESKWLKVAQFVGYQRHEHLQWNTSETPIYKFITTQLTACKGSSLTAILVDEPGIGKTHAAREFATRHPHVLYIDASVAHRKGAFIRELAKQVGCDPNQKLADLEASAIFAIQQMDFPLIIVDEAGDLEHSTLLLVKRLYNALEGICGIFMMGSDGLKSKMDGGIKNKKLGFTELFSRFGKKYSKVLPLDLTEKVNMLKTATVSICHSNGITDQPTIDNILKAITTGDTLGDMRTVKRAILKIKGQRAMGKMQ